jgi:anti-sigma factor RsiW
MMHEHPCVDVRERLEAFHDGELPIEERIAIQNHLTECVSCNLEAEELASLTSVIRDFSADSADLSDEPQLISGRVLERLRVEEQFSIRSQFNRLFQDMHLIWAGLGASAATLVCLIGSASVLHATNQEHPNSMARVIAVLASPGSNDNPLRLNYDMEAPRAVTDAAIEMSEEDTQYALSAVVSREGRVQGVEVLDQPPSRRASVNAMLNEAYRVQFAPATARGDAVAVSMVWLVANTTVKGRDGGDMRALRRALGLTPLPEPIAPLPIPASEVAPKPAAPVLLKPIVPEAAPLALAAVGT